MQSPPPAIHIIVVPPESGAASRPLRRRGAGLAPEESPETVEALGRIAGDVRIDVVSDLAGCLTSLERDPIDLLVLDRCESALLETLLASLGEDAPPAIAVVDQVTQDRALDAFRWGAADCVRHGDDYAEVLPAVALEQIHRWRQLRSRLADRREIARLERYNANIIENMNSALLVVSTDGRIRFANATAASILATDREALLDRPLTDWFGSDPEGGFPLVRSFQEGARFKGAEALLSLEDGTLLPIGISCAPLFEDDGCIGGAVAIFQDLSEIKQLQRQVLQTEKLASIGQLAAGVAHEINNPVGFIHANLQQMKEYLEDLQAYWQAIDALQSAARVADAGAIQRASEDLERVAREVDVDYLRVDLVNAVRESLEGAERIRHIVQDLRDFSHTDTSERSWADVNECVDSTANIVWTMMKHSVELEKQYADLPKVYCYPMQLKQVFMNLIVNAYQSIEEAMGEGEESGRGKRGRIRICSARCDGGICVRISDTGVGIPKRNLARIFDPFFTTKEVGTGTGLGLSTSYGIVQRHAGRMSVESEPGQGATFEVWLPLDVGDESTHAA